ncbi:MAG TPA: hypothetical protein PKA63_01065 [Oligoflexia bacterium]|nr:hypothetical protein [Oligoflexia bacterium]HMP47239.1 hypothetical protein [Oligoflexia bacterium]
MKSVLDFLLFRNIKELSSLKEYLLAIVGVSVNVILFIFVLHPLLSLLIIYSPEIDSFFINNTKNNEQDYDSRSDFLSSSSIDIPLIQAKPVNGFIFKQSYWNGESMSEYIFIIPFDFVRKHSETNKKNFNNSYLNLKARIIEDYISFLEVSDISYIELDFDEMMKSIYIIYEFIDKGQIYIEKDGKEVVQSYTLKTDTHRCFSKKTYISKENIAFPPNKSWSTCYD